MKVWVFLIGERYEGYSIESIHSTEEKAEAARDAYVKQWPLAECDYASISPYVVDEFPEQGTKPLSSNPLRFLQRLFSQRD